MLMTQDQIELLTKLLNIFFPYAASRRRQLGDVGRFVHYTSAANALSIIKSRRIWMRNATCMSDFREVQHGLDSLNRYFDQDANRQAFVDAVGSCSDRAADDAFALFNQWWQNTQLETFITSISEHDIAEDLHGRLSMWRAFAAGTSARVALVVNIPLKVGSNGALGVVISPVAYFTDSEVRAEIDAVVSNIKANCEFLSSIDRNLLVGSIFQMLVTNVICMKHEGFHEEREWRIMHSPKRLPSTLLERSVEVVGGIPQMIYKIPLENNSSVGLHGLAVSELLDRVIIGPTQFPWVMYEAFVAALDEAGVKDAAARVFNSRIPIRT